MPLFGDVFTDVGQDYTLTKKLGSGNFAKVVLGELKRAQPQWKLRVGDHVAVKVVKKPSSRRAVERVQMLRAEVEILRSINHPNIVRLYEIYESPGRLYLVMELLTGGELFDRIVGLGKYSEEDARYFSFKLLNAVLYLHDRNICHRDLKPENILLATPDADAELKITDFGLSKIAAPQLEDFLMTTRCGTPGYVAPEVLAQEVSHGQLRQYGTACDMWSVGVIVYILLSAAPPFYGKTDAEMNRRIKLGMYKFPEKYWASISQPAKDFISRLLTVDPTKRMSAAEALQHDWIVAIGIHTTDLFASGGAMKGVPVMQARFGEFNQERRGEQRQHSRGLKDLFALPEDEEELHDFRCSHANKTGHLVLTPAHLGFLAYDQSTMFSFPIGAVTQMRGALRGFLRAMRSRHTTNLRAHACSRPLVHLSTLLRAHHLTPALDLACARSGARDDMGSGERQLTRADNVKRQDHPVRWFLGARRVHEPIAGMRAVSEASDHRPRRGERSSGCGSGKLWATCSHRSHERIRATRAGPAR